MHFSCIFTLSALVLLYASLSDAYAYRLPAAARSRVSAMRAQRGSDRRYAGESLEAVVPPALTPFNIMYKFSRPHTIKVSRITL